MAKALTYPSRAHNFSWVFIPHFHNNILHIQMKKTFSSKKSAFSLIELSIVLIIIGLLIAGITGGASLIKSSQLRSLMSEARGYAVAVNAFYTQYNALPGDYNTAVGSQTTYVGNGNNAIEYAATHNTIPGSEGTVAWYMLKQVGAISDNLTYAAASTAQVPGTHIPASKIQSAGWAFDYITNNGSSQNVVVLTGTTTAATASTGSTITAPAAGSSLATLASGVILPTDALSVDAKIDDGLASTGKVRGVLTGASSCITAAGATTYNVSQTSKVCALSYQVDPNS